MRSTENWPLHFNTEAKTFKIIAAVETLSQTLASYELFVVPKFLPNLYVSA